MKITIDLTPAELIQLVDSFLHIEQEIETMSGTLSDQLTQAQAAAEAALNDISAKIDAAIAARPADGSTITQDNVDRANRLVSLAQAVSDKLDAAATAPTDPAAPPAA